jgi:hypothetical protein
MDNDLIYAIADDTELDELLSGRQISGSTRWTQWSKPSRLRVGSVGVVWQGEDETIRPLVLIVNEDDLRHLCGRYAQLHSDLSPLTTWCHLLTPRFFEPLESLVRIPDLQGLQAAWTGLTIAEAMLLSEIPLARIKISACWATHSFAIARTNALWSHLTVNDITRRFDNANRLLKSESVAQRVEGRSEKIRTSLRLIWDALIGVSHSRGSHRSADVGPIVLALQGLVEARSAKDPYEANRLIPFLRLNPSNDLIL